MADWYLAPSLAALFDEVDARWPNRDHGSDGSIGNAAHQATVSDHNPDWSAGGVVRAIDVDKDGIDVQQLLDATVGDQRVHYVIWNRRIASATYGWAWNPYTGANPHDHHIHISIQHTHAAETDTSPWFTEEGDMPLTDADVQKIANRVLDTPVRADGLTLRKVIPTLDWLIDEHAVGGKFEKTHAAFAAGGDLNNQLDRIEAKP